MVDGMMVWAWDGCACHVAARSGVYLILCAIFDEEHSPASAGGRDAYMQSFLIAFLSLLYYLFLVKKSVNIQMYIMTIMEIRE